MSKLRELNLRDLGCSIGIPLLFSYIHLAITIK
jgi:hypothetical protein